jgi:probable HAF family extracellular repeat protein
VPRATLTQATGINGRGQIVGFFTDSSGVIHGFLDTNGSITAISVPGSLSTVAQSINDLGQIVGFDDFGGVQGAFLATPANAAREPSSLALITIGLVGLGLIGRLKRA